MLQLHRCFQDVFSLKYSWGPFNYYVGTLLQCDYMDCTSLIVVCIIHGALNVLHLFGNWSPLKLHGLEILPTMSPLTFSKQVVGQIKIVVKK